VARINKDIFNIEKNFKKNNGTPNSLDVMFILDCTSSMYCWIEACKSEIINIIEGVKAKFRSLRIRLSVIAYRDIMHGNDRF